MSTEHGEFIIRDCKRRDFVEHLRMVADGREELPEYAKKFQPRDWRAEALPHLLWESADEIERLRSYIDWREREVIGFSEEHRAEATRMIAADPRR